MPSTGNRLYLQHLFPKVASFVQTCRKPPIIVSRSELSCVLAVGVQPDIKECHVCHQVSPVTGMPLLSRA